MKQLHIYQYNLPTLYKTTILEETYHTFYPNTFLLYAFSEPENKPAFVIHNPSLLLISYFKNNFINIEGFK